MKKYIFSSIIALIVFTAYVAAEKLFIMKIKGDIESSLGSDYAIIALHVLQEKIHIGQICGKCLQRL